MSECDFVDSRAADFPLWNDGRLEKVNLSLESSHPVTIVAMTWFAGGQPASPSDRS